MGTATAQEENSVLDFLYYDARRIGSFLSQFDPAGHLTSRKHTEGATETETRRVALTAKGNALVLEGSAVKDDMTGTGLSDAQELQFDPFWTNALSFRSLIATRGLLAPDIDYAAIGNFVSFNCSLELQDLNLLARITQRPVMRRALVGKQKGPFINEREAELEILAEMDLGCEALAKRAEGPNVWCTLKRDCLTVGDTDLLLKHGLAIAGEWTIVGILDATAFLGEPPRKFTHDEGAEASRDGIRGMLRVIYASMRVELGRPYESHGITPLMIYRNVGGNVV